MLGYSGESEAKPGAEWRIGSNVLLEVASSARSAPLGPSAEEGGYNYPIKTSTQKR